MIISLETSGTVAKVPIGVEILLEWVRRSTEELLCTV
jgi:hypothetical protein